MRRVARDAPGPKRALFDDDSEASYQCRNFGQLVGIVIRDGLCEPNDTFGITYGSDVAGNRRWRRPYEIDHDVWQRTTPVKTAPIDLPW